MRIIRLGLSRFRGFSDLDLYPPANVLLVGEHRAGRYTILDAIRRVLDAGSTRVRPTVGISHCQGPIQNMLPGL